MNGIEKKKKNIYKILGCVILFVVLVSILILKANTKVLATTEKPREYFEALEDSTMKFNGKSIIASEQNIIFDKSLGSLHEVNVGNNQVVTNGEILFSYFNDNIQAQIDEIDRSISSKYKMKERVSQKISSKKDEINKCEDDIIMESLKSELIIEEDNLIEINDILNEYYAQKESLQSKLITNVVSNMEGIVYINESAVNDSSITYMRIISNELLVKCEATEFDISSLKVGDTMDLKVISNEEEMNSIIKSIDNLPNSNGNDLDTYSTYNLYLTPEREIQIGLSVQVKAMPKPIVIPSDCIYEKDGAFFVMKNVNNVLEEVLINAILDNEQYIIQDNSVSVGDKILRDVSAYLEEISINEDINND